MSTYTATPEVQTAANKLIAAAAVKAGYTFDQVPEEARQDAYRYAAAAIAEQEALKANPLYLPLEAEREQHRLTKLELSAVKQTRIGVPNNDAKPSSLEPQVVRQRMGEKDWWLLTQNGRLAACNIPPASVTEVDVQEAKRIFGRGAVSSYSNNAFKTDPVRYRHLKNLAVVLDLQGK
jgi:hypothetical protein